jgi:hypothetical protein
MGFLIRFTLLPLLALFLGLANAAPTPLLEERAVSILSTTQVSTIIPSPYNEDIQFMRLSLISQIASYTTYTYFASASYCSPSLTLSWNCGPACDKLADFKPMASGGDGAVVQYCGSLTCFQACGTDSLGQGLSVIIRTCHRSLWCIKEPIHSS